ncbi:VOC family protein [Streptomyces sp. GC420]|uniref:VOC family protein n=1 Tax=Streptomyces sp. GC420 TaxID=2697568 RepID=UPI001415151B|nr:VOC family protein [Streptomyces sp. GC420]NBM18998.1 VOC family protein [Streptomyces sp. GC420]
MAAYPDGVPCWADAALPDVEAGKRFYGEVFGWTFDESPAREYGFYTNAFLDGRRVAALAPKSDGRMPTVWSVYLAASDARATAERIREAGGRVIMEPLRVGPHGTMAVAADPSGAVFGLWQAGEHTGFEVEGEPGSYAWTEVYTRDKEAVDPFYESVFGFGGFDLPDASIDFRTWSPAGEKAGPETAIGGRSVISSAMPAEMPAHFLVYFAVADCDGTAEHIARLGGRITREPFDTPYGRMSVVSDDQGAVFAVIALADDQ